MFFNSTYFAVQSPPRQETVHMGEGFILQNLIGSCFPFLTLTVFSTLCCHKVVGGSMSRSRVRGKERLRFRSSKSSSQIRERATLTWRVGTDPNLTKLDASWGGGLPVDKISGTITLCFKTY